MTSSPRKLLALVAVLAGPALNPLTAASWQESLATMPLATNTTVLSRTNCIPLLLHSFRSNDVVKALIFMPGATDEFYFFKRAHATLAATNTANASVWDALVALTNQTRIQLTFRTPLLLCHTAEDPVEPIIQIEHAPTADRIRARKFAFHLISKDRDWDYLVPRLRESVRMKLQPERFSPGSWHFYRHSFAAWNLSPWETLETITLAGKTTCTVQRKALLFRGDTRVANKPGNAPRTKFPAR
jgi:hypothetical protein